MKIQLPIPAAPGRGSLAQGFQPTIQATTEQLAAETNALKQRLAAGDIEGEPTAYHGVRVFEPETSSFNLSYMAFNGVQTSPVNYVVRDGQTYDIPILTPGPGVFVATGVTVSIYRRLYDPKAAEPMQQNYSSSWASFYTSASIVAGEPPTFTTKFSLPYEQYAFNVAPLEMSFFWNLLDARTGNLYSDYPLNHLALRPRQDHTLDGGLFKFDTPWVFPYGTGAVFKFQPINPVVQFDSSIGQAVTKLSYDDRENGKRNQSVTVKAVLHGYRMMVAPSPTP